MSDNDDSIMFAPISDELAFFQMHRHGVPHGEADLPPWRHRCYAQTITGHVHIDEPEGLHADQLWCACGGWLDRTLVSRRHARRRLKRRRFDLKNSRRKTRRSGSASNAMLNEGLAMLFLVGVFEIDSHFTRGIWIGSVLLHTSLRRRT